MSEGSWAEVYPILRDKASLAGAILLIIGIALLDPLVLPVAQFQEEAARAVDPAAVMEELQAAKTALQAKGRETSRAAKLAERRIAELETQVEHLQGEAAKTATPVAQEGETKRSRRGRPPGRKNAIDPGDTVPPGVAVLESEPMDPEAEAARDALEKHLTEAQVREEE